LLKRAPHHLLGHKAVGSQYTAAEFRSDALAILRQRSAEGVAHFISVGGSGFYVQALEKGMYEVPEIPLPIREELKFESEKEGGFANLYLELKRRDPEAAGKIKPQDRYRILRALEVLRANNEGLTLTQIRGQFEQKIQPEAEFSAKKIGLLREREVLRKAITQRTRDMLKRGLIDEVTKLRAAGLGDWGPLKSVGYREVQDFLDGRIRFDELEQVIVTSTMQLAKRQMTWFKRDPEIAWFDSDAGWREALLQAQEAWS
jgi:tRNA dimethylallyltransferase